MNEILIRRDDYRSAAVVPTGSINADTVDLNPGTRTLSGVTALNIIAPATTKITLAFYK
jgi:hypothetical protein